MNPRAILVGATLCVACLLTAAASAEVRIAFAGGRVSINATNATAAEILREWARVGGSTFVNLDQLPGGERLSLTLDNVSEKSAIATILRAASGFIIAPLPETADNRSSIKTVFIAAGRPSVSFAEAPASSFANTAQNDPGPYMVSGPPRPDDDGPVRREVPPPPPAQTQNAPTGIQQNPGMPPASSPAGASSTTRNVPGIGVTSTQPGAVINSPATTGRPQRPTVTPTRPGGGGGSRRR